MNLSTIVVIGTEVLSLIGIITPIVIWLHKIVEGQRCQLRETILRIYYKGKESKSFRQYEAEHLEKCYAAYKALKGNSFIDEIYEKMHQWDIES